MKEILGSANNDIEDSLTGRTKKTFSEEEHRTDWIKGCSWGVLKLPLVIFWSAEHSITDTAECRLPQFTSHRVACLMLLILSWTKALGQGFVAVEGNHSNFYSWIFNAPFCPEDPSGKSTEKGKLATDKTGLFPVRIYWMGLKER